MTTAKLLIKHIGSCLPDQPFDTEIVWEEKRIDIRVKAFDSSLFVSFVVSLEAEHGIRAYADDSEGWIPSQPTWALRVVIGETEYLANVVKLRDLGAGSRFSVLLNHVQPLTRDYRKTIAERLVRDSDFAEALAQELVGEQSVRKHLKIRSPASSLSNLKSIASELGIFTEDRELMECPVCGLTEDILFDGRLITYKTDLHPLVDSGLRFSLVDKVGFVCPSCGTTLDAETPLAG